MTMRLLSESGTEKWGLPILMTWCFEESILNCNSRGNFLPHFLFLKCFFLINCGPSMKGDGELMMLI